MDRIFWQLFYVVFLLAILIVPVVAGRVLLRRTRNGTISGLMGFLLFALVVLSPSLLYLGVFFAMVGIEELTGAAIIPEEVGRSLLLVLGFGLLVWLLASVIYAIVAFRAARSRPNLASDRK
jgi:hypothetical protein